MHLSYGWAKGVWAIFHAQIFSFPSAAKPPIKITLLSYRFEMTALALQDSFLPEAATPRIIRADGSVRARFENSSRGTRVASLYESGGYRLKFPRGDLCEAVLVNTGGGMVGGDHFALTLDVAEAAALTVTTQSAEIGRAHV